MEARRRRAAYDAEKTVLIRRQEPESLRVLFIQLCFHTLAGGAKTARLCL